MIIDTKNLTEASFSEIKAIVRVAGEAYWGSPAVKESKLNESVAKGLNFSGYNALSANIAKNTAHTQGKSTTTHLTHVRDAVSQCTCPHCDIELDVENIAKHSDKLSCPECELVLYSTLEGNKTHILIVWASNEISGKEEENWIALNTCDDKEGTVSSVHEASYKHPWFISFTQNLIETGKPLFLSNDELNQDEMVLSVIKQSHDIDTPEKVKALINNFKEEGVAYVYCCPNSGVTMYSEKPSDSDEPNYSAVVSVDEFESVCDPRPVVRPIFGWAVTECDLCEGGLRFLRTKKA
jgi:hypothetical protein